jgi:hypothetical protein
MRRHWVFAAAGLTSLAVLLSVARPVAQQPTLESLMARASDYVVKYFDVMSNLTAEEHYVQDIVSSRPMVPPGSAWGPQTYHRELRSDVNLVQVGPPIDGAHTGTSISLMGGRCATATTD